jgi:TolA-binding protein
MVLIYILIILFIILLAYQVILAFSPTNTLIEGLETQDTSGTSTQEYKPYNVNDPNNSLILAQQNAGNIEVLKGRIDKFDGVKEKIDTMQQDINSMQTQIDGLVQQQADYAQEIAGSTPVDVTGTDAETTENVEDSIEEEDTPN